jgi:hypothetical protein
MEVIIVTGVAFWCGIQWVLGPLHEPARHSRSPAQFTLTDVLCLFFLMALSMGCIHSIFSPSFRNLRLASDTLVYFVDSLAIAAAGLAWWDAVRAMSRVGLQKQWRRVAVLCLAVPFACVGPVAAGFCFLIAYESRTARPLLGRILSAGTAIAATVFALGFFTRWCVDLARREKVGDKPPEDDPGPR